jgi:hypothetical protein
MQLTIEKDKMLAKFYDLKQGYSRLLGRDDDFKVMFYHLKQLYNWCNIPTKPTKFQIFQVANLSGMEKLLLECV